jgi:hypothetical protein
MGHAGCTAPGKKKPNLNRSTIMKRTNKIAAVVLATLGLGLAVASAHAHPGMMGGGMGGGMGPGMMGGMMRGGMGPGAMGSRMAGQQLMTPEEQTAMREKMRNAATPEERQKLAEANHAEMQKRAKEKGVTLPEMRGPGRGMGPNWDQHKH